jgi:membrane-associated phospholipid phosphatase
MKSLIKNNWLLLLLYFALLSVVAFFLLDYGKVEIHLYLNQLVGNPIIDKFFYYITYLGDGGLAPVLLICIMFYNVRLGICCTISFLLAALFTNTIKYYFYDEIMRPFHVFKWYTKTPLRFVEGSELYIHNSFPSGHSTQAFAIFICLSLFVRHHLNKLLFLSIAILVAFSRVYLSQHWLVDITVGSLIGSLSAIVLYYFMVSKDKMKKLDRPLLKFFASESAAQQ